MRLPNKVNSFRESILAKFPLFLEHLSKEERGVCELYAMMKNAVEDVGEFLLVLDCLFALGRIDYDRGKRVLYYVT